MALNFDGEQSLKFAGKVEFNLGKVRLCHLEDVV